MRHSPVTDIRFFFTTQPMACPYLDDQIERRLVTELTGRDAIDINDRLSLAGFRRSHTIAYSPVCENCSACVSVRVPVRDFAPRRTHRRVINRNRDLSVKMLDPVATREQFDLFKTYINSRHGDGDMAMMDFYDYQGLVEDTPIRSFIIELRNPEGHLVACCMGDRVKGGLSAVYSFFEPGLSRRSLGTYMVLWLIEQTRNMGLNHLYLGYWVENSPKMAYKSDFAPLEGYATDGWQRL